MCSSPGEQCRDARELLVGQEPGPGVQGPAGTVERIITSAAVAVEVLLNPAPATVQRVPGQADDVEGIHHCGWSPVDVLRRPFVSQPTSRLPSRV